MFSQFRICFWCALATLQFLNSVSFVCSTAIMINSPLSGSTIINSSIISEKTNSADDYVNQMSNFNQQQQRQVTSFNSSYNYSSKQGNLLNFCSRNKIDVYSLENRIDYHLSRIMKGHRLINFKNSIERLPIEKRICECIIEILVMFISDFLAQ